MDRDTFWEIIDTGIQKSGGVYGVAPIVTQLLEQLSTDEIFSFVQHQDDLMSSSYRHDLWSVAFILISRKRSESWPTPPLSD
jgi:hypothetical protein